MQKIDIPHGYWENGRGEFVPETSVKPLDKLRDGFVRGLFAKAKEQHDQMAMLKRHLIEEIDAFLELSFDEYGEKPRSVKGNLTYYCFDKRLKIEVAVGEQITFDERIQIAKEKIDRCIRKWGDGAHPALMTLINEAFQVDHTGKISSSRVLGLRKHNIDDIDWREAMDAISDARDVRVTKRYIRFYERNDATGEYRHVSLDMASI